MTVYKILCRNINKQMRANVYAVREIILNLSKYRDVKKMSPHVNDFPGVFMLLPLMSRFLFQGLYNPIWVHLVQFY